MDKIKAAIDKSEYGYDDFLNYRIGEDWLDEKLEEAYPGNWYGGLVPTLSFAMEVEMESKVVWERILPNEGMVSNCPVLMCPDDNDFSCTLIIAAIENKGDIIEWQKLGLDQTKEFDPEMVGTTVNWFENIQAFIFEKQAYLKMIEAFRKEFNMTKKMWEQKFDEKLNR
ncbi:MAG: hypothetical protein AB8G15_13000 [Saprospiraceae bacterium]